MRDLVQNIVLEDLILDGGDFFHDGNVTVKGKVLVKNGDITVSGDLTILGRSVITNGRLQVSKRLSFDECCSITNGSISCATLFSSHRIEAVHSDISVDFNMFLTQDIVSSGDISVGKDIYCQNVSCRNFLIGEDNESKYIIASEDIYVLGNSYSLGVSAKEIFINGDCSLNRCTLLANHAEIGCKLIDKSLLICDDYSIYDNDRII